MKLLSNADAILGIDDKEYEDVDIEQWDVTVRIAVMSGASRDKWEMSMMQTDNSDRGYSLNIKGLSRASLVALCLVDEKFNRIFVTNEQIEALSNKSAVVLDRLYEVAQRINGITDEDVEDLEKNSVAVQNGDSGSD